MSWVRSIVRAISTKWHPDWMKDWTADWILKSPFPVLERRVLEFTPEMKEHCLKWALKEYHAQGDPITHREAKMKWAIAVIGTLAPEELYEDDSVLNEEIIDETS